MSNSYLSICIIPHNYYQCNKKTQTVVFGLRSSWRATNGHRKVSFFRGAGRAFEHLFCLHRKQNGVRTRGKSRHLLARVRLAEVHFAKQNVSRLNNFVSHITTLPPQAVPLPSQVEAMFALIVLQNSRGEIPLFATLLFRRATNQR